MSATSPSPHPAVAGVVAEVADLLRTRERLLVGLVGPPGTGKSTAADALVADLTAVGVSTALVPMDGFHLDQRELERLGRQDRKGAPDSFDAAGYVALLRRLREASEPVTYAPRFDRHLEQSVGSAVAVPADTQVVVTEGNYLLLEPTDLPAALGGTDPTMRAWAEVHDLLDRCWYVDVDPALRLERLVARHVAHGRTPEGARAWVEANDEVNARLVEATRDRADAVLAWS